MVQTVEQDVMLRRLVRRGATVQRVMVGLPNGQCVRSYTVTLTLEREEIE